VPAPKRVDGIGSLRLVVTDRLARISLTTIFAATGVLVGSWAARIPAVQSEFHFSLARLGLALACMTIGSIVSSPLAGFVSTRYGSRSLLRISAPFQALTFAFIALAPSPLLLALALFLMGATSGLVQVSMNAQAIALEARYGRTILSKMHGGFSIGMMAGALAASLVAYLGVSYRAHLLTVSMLLLAVGIGIGFFLIETERIARAHRRRIHLSLALAVIVVVSFFELFCEGTATSWGAVYAHTVGSSAAIAALTLGIYSLTMTVGRLRGDHLVVRMGVGGLVRAGSAVAICGLGLALAFPTPLVVLVGFALFGLGLSCLAPTLFRAAGQLPLPEGQGLAALLVASWPAFLLVAPVIGGLSKVISLREALLVTLGAALAMVALSGPLGRLAPTPVGTSESTSEPEYPL
jgi:MFS family permease